MMVSGSGTSRSSFVALRGLSVGTAEPGTEMAPETPSSVNGTVSPNYMEPVRLMQFNPALVGVVMAMIISFFLVGFATGFLKKCNRPAEADPEDGVVHRRGRSRGPASKSQRGLDPEILEALPRVQYKDLPADKYFDCSVCLAVFDATDSLRLLPVCSHAFHSDCIDVWFLSHSTCPLCRACLQLPMEKASGVDAEDGEQAEISLPEGFDVVEVVIDGDSEQDRSRSIAISESLQDRTGGAPIVNSSTAEEKEERVNAQLFLRSTAVGSFKPAVRVVMTPKKAAALASIHRSNSAGNDLQLLHPSYVVDSEGTQHNRNYQTHAIDVEEFLVKDHHGAHAQPSGSSSRLPVDTGASSVT